MHINCRMSKKSRKYNKKTAKTRKQRGGFVLQPVLLQQEGGSWLSGLTDKVKGLFSIDQPAQQQEPTQQAAQQAAAQVTVPPSESIRLQPQPGWTNVPLNATPRKKKNNMSNWNIVGNNNIRPI